MRHTCRDLGTLVALATLLACGTEGGSSAPPDDPSPGIVAAHSPTEYSALAGTAVEPPPAVKVTDTAGAPLKGIAVIFAVTGGGGSAMGDSAITDDSGVAVLGSWTLGATPGANSLTAKVDTFAPVLFSAQGTAPGDPCAHRDTLPWNVSTAGTLTAGDCQVAEGRYTDRYIVDLDTLPLAFAFLERSDSFDTYLTLEDTAGHPVAFNNDSVPGFYDNSAIVLIAPAGRYVVGATSYDPLATGPYTLRVRAASNQVTSCRGAFVLPGFQTDQMLLDDDCRATDAAGATLYSDRFWIHLDSLQQVTIDETSASFDALVAAYDGVTGQLVDWNDDASDSTLNARLVLTAPKAGFYIVLATTAQPLTQGYYALTIQPTAAGAGGPSPRSTPARGAGRAAPPAALDPRQGHSRGPS